jgi:hypothetical protein
LNVELRFVENPVNWVSIVTTKRSVVIRLLIRLVAGPELS